MTSGESNRKEKSLGENNVYKNQKNLSLRSGFQLSKNLMRTEFAVQHQQAVRDIFDLGIEESTKWILKQINGLPLGIISSHYSLWEIEQMLLSIKEEAFLHGRSLHYIENQHNQGIKVEGFECPPNHSYLSSWINTPVSGTI